MKYTVTIEKENETVKEITNIKLQKEAIKIAKSLRGENHDTYISFYRSSDGQYGYINQFGAGPNGVSW